MYINENLKRFLSSVILLLLIFYIMQNSLLLFNIFLFILLIISIYEFCHFRFNKLIIFFGCICLLFSFYCVYLFRNANNEYSMFYFSLVIITCISTDIGGFIFGKLIKGPKITKISPNKTYAGVFGSYFLSIISFYFFLDYSNKQIFFSIEFVLIIILISSISQLGDLIISFFKRVSNIKDTGKIIPGHGGLLDRIDGMIFAFPTTYLFFVL